MKYIESKNGYFYKIKNNTKIRIPKEEYLKKVKKGGAAREEGGGGGGEGEGGVNSENGSIDIDKITTIDSYISSQRKVLKEQLDKYQKMEDILTMYNYIKSYLDKYNKFIKDLKTCAEKGCLDTLCETEKVNYTLLINKQIERLEQLKRLEQLATTQYSQSNKKILDDLILLYNKLLDIFKQMYTNNEQYPINLFFLKIKLIQFLYPFKSNDSSNSSFKYRLRTTKQVNDNKEHIMRVFDLTKDEFVDLKRKV